MAQQNVAYSYLVTIQVNDSGRVASASGNFFAPPDINRSARFTYAMNDARPQLRLGKPVEDEAIPYPDLKRYSVLFYTCDKEGD